MQKTAEYKVLIFKGDRSKILGRYAMPGQAEGDVEWYGGDTPQILPMTATIEGLKRLYPSLDMRKVKLVIVTLEHVDGKM